ncbi:PREDICTED: WD repeat-containing protein 46 [Nicrophorus vespilloides]|uniref:WD repeat-containing protein 46 n=1 Tax=Nicrophorus vespilloides TaxID=110193 RepID=A0ABM1MJA7_NICVS|nr:PREDICTED: WD repeat-containing protein 46 [Nicrophorus vespilloides]
MEIPEPKPKTKREIRKDNNVKIRQVNEVLTYNVNQKKVLSRYHKKQLLKKTNAAKRVKKGSKIPGRAPVPKGVVKKYDKGDGVSTRGITGIYQKEKWKNKENQFKKATEQSARVEILLSEKGGGIEADEGEKTKDIKQIDIVKNVDVASAAKSFELHLNEFGPYQVKYTRNGKHMLLAGKLGHMASFNWFTKKLACEINVMESIHDICYLHVDTMFACAQKKYLHIYDNTGTELHCLRKISNINKLEFLPYHFLLAAGSDFGKLQWLDVSVGEVVGSVLTKQHGLSTMVQNPYNAVLCTGSTKGDVAMWTPNCQEPVAKLFCHKSPVTAMDIDPSGLYMATAGSDFKVKIWDARNLEKTLQVYKIPYAASNVSFSQTGLMAVSNRQNLDIYRDCCATATRDQYLVHRFKQTITNMKFCPFEDVLGVGTQKGFTSLLIPGAGEANFDALELNPYQYTSQRKEGEVKALLEKIPYEMISLNPSVITEVDVPTMKEQIEMKQKLHFIKPPQIDYKPRNKAKGKGGSVNNARNKKIAQEKVKKDFYQKLSELEEGEKSNEETKKSNVKANNPILQRFL